MNKISLHSDTVFWRSPGKWVCAQSGKKLYRSWPNKVCKKLLWYWWSL